jgi:hypothetical protein
LVRLIIGASGQWKTISSKRSVSTCLRQKS